MKFPLHQPTVDLLKGLSGIEIGAAAHNPFYVDAKNVAPQDRYEFYSREQLAICGEVASIDIDAYASAIPIPDHSQGFVLSSHVVEHLPDIVAAFDEWERVTVPGGYVVMVVPQRNALKADISRPLSRLGDILDARGLDSRQDKHRWVFTSDSLIEIIASLKPDWRLVGKEDPDKKVGNGFWLAYQLPGEVVREQPPVLVARPPIAIVIPTLNYDRGIETGALALGSAGCEARLVISAGEQRGFTKTVNDGIRRTTDEDVCILNDDITEFQPNWLAELSDVLHSQPQIGIVGPGGKSGTAPSRHGRPGMQGWEECRELSYWCVLVKREMINAIGILDERFIHYCSDNEYNQRVRKSGWKIVWVRSVYLEHQYHGSGYRKEWLDQDREIFRKVVK